MLRLRNYMDKGNLVKISSIKSICVICMDTEANFTLLPCTHQVLCSECVNWFELKFTQCPLCRRDFSLILKMK
jgi:hypothetical protein